MADAARPPAVSGTTYHITVTFDGKTPVSNHAAGEASVAFTGASTTTRTPSTKTGELATFKRGGLSAQINGARNTVGNGATQYQSVVRVTNNGHNPGSVYITLFDGETGEKIDTWKSPMIHPKGMLQVTVAQLENGLGIDPEEIGFYTIDVEGPVNGYVQHLNWNSVDNLFSDLSGFRQGEGINTDRP